MTVLKQAVQSVSSLLSPNISIPFNFFSYMITPSNSFPLVMEEIESVGFGVEFLSETQQVRAKK